MSFTVLIPARYASSRFPGKPLADLGGKPMVVRVCERAKASGARSVHVATDDQRIAEAVRAAGHSALMTRSEHASGTDRLAEAAGKLKLKPGEIVVNVQGDEPLIEPKLISRVASLLQKKKQAVVATACHAIHDAGELDNPNVVKVAMDAQGYALYFSRSRIPFPRDGAGTTYRHVGLYAYRVGFLKKFSSLKVSPLEATEALEQLRVLWHGYRIAVLVAEGRYEPGVDTREDLQYIIQKIKFK